jgi:hypothetical protein
LTKEFIINFYPQVVKTIKSEIFNIDFAVKLRYIYGLTWQQCEAFRLVTVNPSTGKPKTVCGIPLPKLPDRRKVIQWAVKTCPSTPYGKIVNSGVMFDVAELICEQIVSHEISTTETIHYQIVKDGCRVVGNNPIFNVGGRVLSWNPRSTFGEISTIGIFDGQESLPNVQHIFSQLLNPAIVSLQQTKSGMGKTCIPIEFWGGCDMKLLSILMGLHGDFRGQYCCPWRV